MQTTTISSICVGEHAGALGRRDRVSHAVRLAGTFAANAAVLLAGFRLTGSAWSELGFLVLPQMRAGSGAALAFFARNRTALRPGVPRSEVPRSEVPLAAESPPGHADVVR